MQDAGLKFVDFANPHSWLLTAVNLHDQALFLNCSIGRSMLTRTDQEGDSTTWDGVNKSVFLLGGFALENAIKAFLVYENPQWISNGKLSSQLRSHSLVLLQKKSQQIPYKNRYVSILREFEAGLESWARYPTRCPGFVSGPKTDGNTLAIGIGLERPLDGKLRTNATLFGSPVGHARDLSGSLVDL